MSQTKKSWSAYQWVILSLLFLGLGLSQIDRVNVAVVVPLWIKRDHMSKAEAGAILAVADWAYLALLLVAGPLIDRFRPKRVYAIGAAIWASATALTGMVPGGTALVGARALVGAGQSPMIPASASVTAEMYPKTDRTSVVGTYMAGIKCGLAVGVPLASVILVAYGWQAVFFGTSALTVLWLVLWLVVYRPNKVAALRKGSDIAADGQRESWLSLLTHRSTWALIIGHFGYLYLFYLFASWLPGYLVLERHMTVLKSGIIGALPFILATATSILGGLIADFWIRHGGERTVVRKIFVCGGLILAAVFVAATAFAPSTVLAVTFITCDLGCIGLVASNAQTLPIDLAPTTNVSSLASLQAFGGNLGGALAPFATGLLLSATGNFQLALLVAGGITLILGAGSYGLLLGRVERRGDVAAQEPVAVSAPIATGG